MSRHSFFAVVWAQKKKCLRYANTSFGPSVEISPARGDKLLISQQRIKNGVCAKAQTPFLVRVSRFELEAS